METLKLELTGMGCDRCVANVRKALEQVPGVEIRNVAIGSADLAYDPGKATPKAITDALAAAGYPPKGAAGEASS